MDYISYIHVLKLTKMSHVYHPRKNIRGGWKTTFGKQMAYKFDQKLAALFKTAWKSLRKLVMNFQKKRNITKIFSKTQEIITPKFHIKDNNRKM